MSQDDFKPKLGRMRDAGRTSQLRHTTRVFRQAGKAGIRALRQRGHISPSALTRGMGAGVRAAAGLIAPGSRRVIVKARYTRIVGGDLGAARAHIKYILRDGVTREGLSGHLYDATHDEADSSAFLDRSEQDPHQFRFIVSAEDSARLADLNPLVRDLLSQMERDLDTKLDWVAVDHFNTGHPHTHIVIRGRDDQGRDLVMARDYIAHGVRARAQGLVTFELGPETELERVQKLFNETGQERLTRLDRSLLARAKDGILVITTDEEHDPVQQTLKIGRLKTLERLGLAQEACVSATTRCSERVEARRASVRPAALTQVGPRLRGAMTVGFDPQGNRLWRLSTSSADFLPGRDRRDSAASALGNISPNDELSEAEEIPAQGAGPVNRLAP